MGNINVMGHWLSLFFRYLDRFYVPSQAGLASLIEVPVVVFCDRVYKDLKRVVRDTVIALIDKEREGEKIDRALVKKAVDIFVGIGILDMDFYQQDFEEQMIDDAGRYYLRKARSWILNDSCPEYMIKAEECLKKERDRAVYYFHTRSKSKLIEKVQHELLVVHRNQLLENEKSGCRALISQEKFDDLSRIFRLYDEIPTGLEPVAGIFKQYIMDQGKALVHQAEEDVRNKTANMEQNFVRKILELHDKFMAYVSICFGDHKLFLMALKEAFEVFCNESIVEISSAEILATFCDNLFKNSDAEKLSDETVKRTMDKVIVLLGYVRMKLKKILKGLPEPRFASEECLTLYTIVYNLCSIELPSAQDCSYLQRLCVKYREVFEEHKQSDILPSFEDKRGEFMLHEFVKQWENINVMGRWLFRFFEYLDRFYVRSQAGLASLIEVPVVVFRDWVYKDLKRDVRDTVIALIDKEREGEKIDRALVKKAVDIFVGIGILDMDFYQQDFEEQMIDGAGRYYLRKARSWILNDSCPEYMIKAEECLKKERDRAVYYFHTRSKSKLIEKVQHELLVVQRNQLLENEKSGCRALISQEKFDDLSRIFRLYDEIPTGLEPVAGIFKQYIIDQGKALVHQAEEDVRNKTANMEQNFVGKILELHDKFMAYVSICFGDHKLFLMALKEAFEVFCNESIVEISSAEILATFCDNLFKNSDAEKLSDETVERTMDKVIAVERTMDKVIVLLGYFKYKDLFAEFYRKKLARRLVFDKGGNKDYDKTFLSKLKQHSGGHFTTKMEGMITDVVLARENQTALDDWFSSNLTEKPRFDLSVMVLTTGSWPSYRFSDLNLPSEMVKGVESFEKFYGTKTKARKLTWIYSLGNCHVNGKFEQKAIELIVSTYQAACLMLFNDADRLSFSEILTQLNLNQGDLIRVLHSLSCSKHKILNKEPNTKTISQSDSFEFNAKFTDRMRRIRIPLPPVDGRRKINEDVGKDRRHNIDAALVRIMKSRKVLGYQQLISECVEMLSHSFKPEIKAIKSRIDDLINREFIERDSKEPTMFKYLA